MEQGRVRIADIAEKLGLSTTTVSNVIHGKTKKISDETVKRVQALLEEKKYIPNMAGILLAQNSSRIVGVIINNHEKYEGHVLEDCFISAALNSLSQEIHRAGFFMMVETLTDWNEIVRIASMWNMEGLILIGFCDRDYQKLRESMHIPFVVYDGYFGETEGICNLSIDDYDGGRQMGEYLKRMGHEKVLCIADNYICMDKERIEGCKAALGEEKVGFLQIPFEKEARKRMYRERLGEILEYTAVFAASDFYAAELMHSLQEQGICVPDDISVAGFDDSFDHGTDSPPFSTQLVVPSPFVASTRPETFPEGGLSTFFEMDSTSGVKTAFTTRPPSMDDEKEMPEPLRIETMSDAMSEPSLTADIPVM